jgi:hypothetical protein
MNAAIPEPVNLGDDQAKAIASLSEMLDVPVSEVRHAYLQELARLRSQARIHSFLPVLAFKCTRSILRSRNKHQSGA